MFQFLLILNTVVAIMLVVIILMQKSEGGVLGMGSSKMGGVLSSTSAGNMLVKWTVYLGVALFIITLTLAVMASRMHKPESNISKYAKEKESSISKSEIKKIPEDRIAKELKEESKKK